MVLSNSARGSGPGADLVSEGSVDGAIQSALVEKSGLSHGMGVLLRLAVRA